jgi:hypothetical protein
MPAAGGQLDLVYFPGGGGGLRDPGAARQQEQDKRGRGQKSALP